MRTFKQFLLEKVMDVPTAMKVFGITTIPKPEELKIMYRKLAMNAHPDRGGSTELMKDINTAYALLQHQKTGSAQGGSRYTAPTTEEKEEMAEKFFATAQHIQKAQDVLLRANIDKFAKHFDKLSQGKQSFTANFSTPVNYLLMSSSKGIHYFMDYAWQNVSWVIEIANADRTIVFTAKLETHLPNLWQKSVELAGQDMIEKMDIYVEGLYDNRKNKIFQKSWGNWADSKQALSDPAVLFKTDKLAKILSGNSRSSKSSKFAKRDAEMILKNDFEATYEGFYKDSWNVFLKKEKIESDGKSLYKDSIALFMYRTTFLRAGTWNITSIAEIDNNGRFNKIGDKVKSSIPMPYIPETEQAFMWLVTTIKAMQKKKNIQDMMRYFDSEYTRAKGAGVLDYND